MKFYLGKKAAGRTQARNKQSVGTSSFGATAPMMVTCFVRATSLALICLLTPASFGQTKRSKSDSNIHAIGRRTITHAPNFYSPEHEKELGAKLALETEKPNRMIESPWIQAYVERVAQRVEGNSDKHIPLTIRLIDSETVEAFTLPGGYQYITRGPA